MKVLAEREKVKGNTDCSSKNVLQLVEVFYFIGVLKLTKFTASIIIAKLPAISYLFPVSYIQFPQFHSFYSIFPSFMHSIPPVSFIQFP